MVEFSSESSSESIERHVEEADVVESALRIVVQKHEEQHDAKKEKHKVTVRDHKDPFNEKENDAIKQIKKEVGGEYKRATAESTTKTAGLYQRASAEEGGGYEQHGHREEASCTCGWRATPQDAMKEFLGAGKVETGVKYESSAGKAGYSSKHQGLEGMAMSYSSPLEQNQMVYQ